jgi:uncharacterized protein
MTKGKSSRHDDGLVRRRTTRWLEGAVIGLKLCPFAEPVVRRGSVRLTVSRARDIENGVRDVLQEAVALIEATPSQLSTTLVILPDALGSFDDFLEAAAAVEEALDASEVSSFLQLASFHPHYRFLGVEPDDLGNFTNRAPYPILQLLRVEEVGQALDGHPEPEAIPERNIARLLGLGPEALASLWAEWEEEE